MGAARGSKRDSPLEAYRGKRSAERTSEPFGAGEAGGGETETDWTRPRLYVIQKHAARRLHFDFRLEWSGTL